MSRLVHTPVFAVRADGGAVSVRLRRANTRAYHESGSVIAKARQARADGGIPRSAISRNKPTASPVSPVISGHLGSSRVISRSTPPRLASPEVAHARMAAE